MSSAEPSIHPSDGDFPTDARAFSVSTREAGAVPLAIAVTRGCGDAGACDRVAQAFLRGDEPGRYARFKVQHARTDFLAGRIAAKRAVAAVSGRSLPADWEIVRGIWHQPCLRGPHGGVRVTLAHSGGMAVAAAFDDRLRCGIDLEKRTRDAAEIVETQVSADECAWARAGAPADNPRWMLLWTAREALGKCLESGLLFPERLLPTCAWNECDAIWRASFLDNDLLTVRSMAGHAFVASLVLPSEIAGQAGTMDALAWLARALP